MQTWTVLANGTNENLADTVLGARLIQVWKNQLVNSHLNKSASDSDSDSENEDNNFDNFDSDSYNSPHWSIRGSVFDPETEMFYVITKTTTVNL